LISVDGAQLGIVPLVEALRRAEEEGYDLVEVAPEAQPAVCRIMDFKKLLYEQRRKVKEARKKQKLTDVKEIKMRPTIDPHDYGVKLNHARDFLERGDKVKFTLFFRGREFAHGELGEKILDRITNDLSDIAEVESRTKGLQRLLSLVVMPKRESVSKKTEHPDQV
jgi:translation initiation factor IF-3